MKKRKILWKISSSILIFLVLFVLLILFLSANWFVANFGEVDVSVAIYQLLSPLQGTDSDVLNRYCRECLSPSVLIAGLVVLVYNINVVLEKISLELYFFWGKKQLTLKSDTMFGWLFKKKRKQCLLCIIILLLCAGVWRLAVKIDIPGYVENVTNVSNIFEEEYVNPESVDISFPEEKRNLILIYMESMEATYASVEAGGGKPVNYIPELTVLAEENISFSNDENLGGAGSCPDTGWTMGGLMSSSTGVPYKLPIDGNSAGDYESFLPGIIGLGDVLGKEGYSNYFMCGSDAVFGGRAAFFYQHGNYQMLDYGRAKQDGIIPEDYKVFWGMEDAKLYEYAQKKLTEISAENEPFNFTMLTVDTHASDGYICSLCDNQYPEQYANAIACSSRQLYQFVEWAKEQEWYKDTTIVITGDHISMKADFWDDIGDYDRKIYNCFINLPEGLVANQTVNRDFTILDMFPTILTAMDVEIEGNRLGLGTNLFSKEKTLPEKMGWEAFNSELKLNSNYYYNFMVTGT